MMDSRFLSVFDASRTVLAINDWMMTYERCKLSRDGKERVLTQESPWVSIPGLCLSDTLDAFGPSLAFMGAGAVTKVNWSDYSKRGWRLVIYVSRIPEIEAQMDEDRTKFIAGTIGAQLLQYHDALVSAHDAVVRAMTVQDDDGHALAIAETTLADLASVPSLAARAFKKQLIGNWSNYPWSQLAKEQASA